MCTSLLHCSGLQDLFYLAKKNPFIIWGAISYFLCDQVASAQGLYPCGRMWWAMGIWASEEPLKFSCSPSSQITNSVMLSQCLLLIQPGCVGLEWVGRGSGMHVAVFILVILAAKLYLPGLYISTPVTVTRCSVSFLSSWSTYYCSFPLGLLLAWRGWLGRQPSSVTLLSA